MFGFDRNTARLLGAVMGWPVIIVAAWLGGYFFGTAGWLIGTFVGLFGYFFGIYKVLPKDPPKSDK